MQTDGRMREGREATTKRQDEGRGAQEGGADREGQMSSNGESWVVCGTA